MSGLLPLLTEDVSDLITDYLKANINQVLATVDFKYQNSGIPLTPIQLNNFWISDGIEPLILPACFVLFGEHAFQYSDNQNYLTSEDRCIVVISVEEIGTQGVTRKAWRYGRAMFGVLNLARLVTTDQRLEIVCIPQTLAYSAPISGKLTDQQKKYRKDVVLEMKILHYEKNET